MSLLFETPTTRLTVSEIYKRKWYSLLTYSMVQILSWEANWFAASQEIPRILWNPKVHYRTHKRPPPVPVLVQPNPVHIPTSHILEIHPNIIHPSTPRSPQWSLSLRFPHQDPIHPLLLTHTRRMPSRLTLNIPSLARQRCLSSWGPRRTPWFSFCNFSTVWCGRLLKLCFLGFWNYNSVIQALLASNILCLFISTEVSQ